MLGYIFILIIIGLAYTIIGITYKLFIKTGLGKKLNDTLDSIDAEPSIILSKFNKNDKQGTTIDIVDNYLIISTDIKIYELKENGAFRAKISSEMDDLTINAELKGVLLPSVFNLDNNKEILEAENQIGFIYTSNDTLDTLKFLKNQFDINYTVKHKGIAFMFNKIKLTNVNSEIIKIDGKFPDQSNFMVEINLKTFRLDIEAHYKSVMDESNFPLVFFE